MYVVCDVVLFFKQKTAYEMRISDWSSDVCSSDLLHMAADEFQMIVAHQDAGQQARFAEHLETVADAQHMQALFGFAFDVGHDGRARRDGAGDRQSVV